MKFFKYAAAATAIACTASANAQVVINEIMQSNVYCIMDDINEFPDSWVELYNAGPTAVNVGGYVLALDKKNKNTYTLPSKTLNPNSYLLVYCDKEEGNFHAPYRLDSGKGSLYLFNPEGEIVDQIESIKKQPAPNVAYGRESDNNENWGYMITPTPGQRNQGGISSTILAAPIFSVPGGVWKDRQNISLELSIPEGMPSDTRIIYTTDGSEPLANHGNTYTAPISISNSTAIRAKLISDQAVAIPSTVHSYLFLGREVKLPVISITMNREYLYDNTIGIFADGYGGEGHENYRYDWRRPMNIELFDVPEGGEAAINQLGETRVQGGYTRSNPLKSMMLYANKRFGENKRYSYEFWPKDKPGITENKRFVLRNGGNDFGWAYIRDGLAQRVMGRNADLDWQGYAPAIVFINGKYHAMLAIRECSSEDNIYANYDGLEDIDMFENWYELKAGDWTNRMNFLDFYSTTHPLAEWEEVMDVVEYTNLMIINCWVYNEDFPHNNIVMWRPTADGGKWRWIAKDMDFGLGIWDTNEHKYYSDYFKYLSNSTNEATMIYRNLMHEPEYKEMFLNRWIAYTGDFMNEENWLSYFDEILEENHGELKISDDKWSTMSWWHSLQAEHDGIRRWIQNRHRYLPTLLISNFGLGNKMVVQVNQNISDDVRQQIHTSYAGIPLTTGKFNGFDYIGRTVNVSAQDGDPISGWNVKIQGHNTFYPGLSVSVPITSATSIIIDAEYDPSMSGIHSISPDVQTGISYSVDGNSIVTNVDCEVFDLRGVKVGNTQANKPFAAPAHGVYILKAPNSAPVKAVI